LAQVRTFFVPFGSCSTNYFRSFQKFDTKQQNTILYFEAINFNQAT
jgi:hypothetical protein